MTQDEKLDLILLRVEQLIVLYTRKDMTNDEYSKFAREVWIEIEQARYDKGEASLNPVHFPHEILPKHKTPQGISFEELFGWLIRMTYLEKYLMVFIILSLIILLFQ